ncbi:MAG: apolipoprotein N-acyltransferase [Treponema sp.]
MIYTFPMRFYAQILAEISSSIMLALAIPNEFLKFGSALLGFASLVPHFTALENCTSLKRACFLCFLQSCLTHVLSSFWLAFFKDFAVFTLGASALGTGAIHAFFGLFFFLPKFRIQNSIIKPVWAQRLDSRSFKIFWFAAVYTVYECAKSKGFLAYPWGTLPMTAYSLKILAQITDITGVRGLTFLFSFASALIAVILSDSIKFSLKKSLLLNRKLIFAAAGIFALAGIYGIFQYAMPSEPVKIMNTVFVQQNYDPWLVRSDEVAIKESQELTLQGIADFKKQKKRPDLVVWSEGILNYPFPEGMIHYKFYPESEPLIPFISKNDVPVIIGAPYTLDAGEGKFYNAAVLIDKDGKLQGFHAKTHLVPFAELIPFTEYEAVRKLLKKLIGFSNGWTQGTEYKVFPIPLHSSVNAEKADEGESAFISIPICFEDAFGDVCAKLKKSGTEVFVNITDDSWSLTKSAEYQHFVTSYFRAIEFRTTLVRSTNSGYTVIVDPKGKIIADLPLFEKTYLSQGVPVYKNISTSYMLFGEWLSLLFAAFILFVLIKITFFFE